MPTNYTLDNPFEQLDEFHISKYRTVYTSNELGIPGLRMFGKDTMLQARAPLEPHLHRNAYEFTFVAEGTIHFTASGKDYDISGYEVFMTRPNEVHSTNLIPLSAGEIIWFQLDVSEAAHFLYLDDSAAAELQNGLAQLEHHLFRLGSISQLSLLKKAFELAGNPRQRCLVSAYLVLVLWEIINNAAPDKPAVSPDIEKVLSYINEHITAELTLEELAGICSLSVSQFKQKFKAQVGTSPRNYINYHKMQTAKKMLQEYATGIAAADSHSITEIAMDLGYSSSSYFTVVFKRYNACTPTEYLRQLTDRI